MRRINIWLRTPLIIFFVSLCACAHKPGTIIPADKKKKQRPAQSRILLPIARRIEVTQEVDHTLLTWEPIEPGKVGKNAPTPVGYNVYGFYKEGFVPSCPLNRDPLLEPLFKDFERQKHGGKRYIIRGVYPAGSKTVLGPASRAVSLCSNHN